MPLWLIIVLISIGALIVLYFGFTFGVLIHMGFLLTRPKYKTRQGLIENAHHEEWPGYFDLKQEPFALKMRDGYIINGDVKYFGYTIIATFRDFHKASSPRCGTDEITTRHQRHYDIRDQSGVLAAAAR